MQSHLKSHLGIRDCMFSSLCFSVTLTTSTYISSPELSQSAAPTVPRSSLVVMIELVIALLFTMLKLTTISIDFNEAIRPLLILNTSTRTRKKMKKPTSRSRDNLQIRIFLNRRTCESFLS